MARSTVILLLGLLTLTSLHLTYGMTLSDQPEINEIAVEDTHLVKTENGQVSGIEMASRTGKKVIGYLGIPYAEPPVGELRFKRPELLKEPFKGVFKAHKEPVACYQHGPDTLVRLMRNRGFNIKRPFTEDCLQLNVYVPEDCPEKASVLVYFHAGAFYLGSSTSFVINGATLAAEEKIIVVTINYRLGALGFLSLNHEEAPGNAGLMDQQMAMIWVNKNIAAFGGNPNDVTLGGTSAGSASVGYHILSPASKGLFQKALMQSGVPANPWAYGSVETVVKKSYEVATNNGYRGKMDPPSVAKFLRSLDPEDINDGNQYRDFAAEANMILPTVDGYFLRKDPDHAIVDAVKQNNIQIMIGTMSDEGALFALMSHPDLFYRYEDHSINFYEYERIVRAFGFGDDETSAIVNNYVLPEKRGDPHYLRDLATETVGDYLISCDVNEFADYLASQGNKVFKFVLDGKPPEPKGKEFLPTFTKAIHGGDIPILFGHYLPTPDSATPDIKGLLEEYIDFAKRTMKRYGNFIKHGDPSLNLEGEERDFPRYTKEGGETLTLKVKHDEVTHHFRAETCHIFQQVVPLVETYVDCKEAAKYKATRIRPHHDVNH